MANWAFTDYAIEGPKEILEKIHQALLYHDVQEGSDKNWEGNVLLALGCTWKDRSPDGSGHYLRGFIHPDSIDYNGDGLIRFDAEEAWGVTDFDEVLKTKFPEVKIYWSTEESGCEIYETNDKEGKYFHDRVYVDTCIDDNYQMEYFQTLDGAYKWLSEITNGRVKTKEDVDSFNETADSLANDDFIAVHEYRITA